VEKLIKLPETNLNMQVPLDNMDPPPVAGLKKSTADFSRTVPVAQRTCSRIRRTSITGLGMRNLEGM